MLKLFYITIKGLRVRVELKVMAIKWYSTLLKALELKPHRQMVLGYIQATRWESVTPLQSVVDVFYCPNQLGSSYDNLK